MDVSHQEIVITIVSLKQLSLIKIADLDCLELSSNSKCLTGQSSSRVSSRVINVLTSLYQEKLKIFSLFPSSHLSEVTSPH